MTQIKSRPGRQPYAWSEAKLNEISTMWRNGVAIMAIAEMTGFSAPTISRKIKELGLSNIERPEFRRAKRAARNDNLCDTSWDEKVFESWADRKARLARERAA